MKKMRLSVVLAWVVIASQPCEGAFAAPTDSFEAPAVLLVACDPYFSIWSTGARLTDVDTTHWTGKPHRLTSLASIDGKVYRLIGREPATIPPLEQVGRSLTPTQTRYRFAGGGTEIAVTFTTPALPEDIDLLSRPITYLTYTVSSTDEKSHNVRLYFEASAELTVDVPEQAVGGQVERPGELVALRLGSQEQDILGRQGDDLRIDWGYFYLAAPASEVPGFAIAAPKTLRDSFAANKAMSSKQAVQSARADELSAAVAFELPRVASKPVTRYVILAYDDVYSIEYMQHRLRPYWRRNGLDAKGLLTEAARDYQSLVERCDTFDRELVSDLTTAGGEDYAQLATLCFRQCFAAGKFVADANGQPLQFCKENHSNGCIATSDVFYPMAPQFLLFGSSLAKSFVVPFMNYAASDRWRFPFAPHDLGTYPKANGQVYGGGETSERDQMPVEESGNLLILMAAIAKIDGNADFAGEYWPQLESWAAYLREKGFDPENQLCTDDFAGHLAHNVNLSAKAIFGLGAFAQLCELRGEKEKAREYRQVAEEFAARWVAEADDGDHFRLAFDKPGTWSQKYNLVWDRVLGLNLFPESVYRKEMGFYRRNVNRYGLPLDCRETYTKLDWILWTATLTGNRDDFQALVIPVMRFVRETPDHQPLTDWYQTESGKKVGFTARPVVGGVFMQMLCDDEVCRKWANRDRTMAAGYARLPQPPEVRSLVAAADSEPAKWRFTTERPQGDWQAPDFDDSAWQSGDSGFGTRETPGARVGTEWNTADIWLRREFDAPQRASDRWRLKLHHDEDTEVYINGVAARQARGYTTDYGLSSIRPEALAAVKPTANVLAVHCHQSTGGQYIDVGIVTLDSVEESAVRNSDSLDDTAPVSSALQ